MRLRRNMPSLRVYNGYSKNLEAQSVGYRTISSGLKVQTYKDDPNAKAKSDRLTMEIRGLQMANRNIQDTSSMLQTMDGGMQTISESVLRIRELINEAGGASTESDKQVIQSEIDVLMEDINYTANNTEMNGVNLIGKQGGDAEMSILTGSSAEDRLDIEKFDLTTHGLGLSKEDGTSLVNSNDIDGSLKKLDAAMEKISNARSKYGALANRMESTYNSRTSILQSVSDSEANTTGADIAEEILEYSKNSILVQAGISMMSQTNKLPQDVLTILQNVRSR